MIASAQLNIFVKGELIKMTVAWDEVKKLIPRHESNPWPTELRVGALSTDLEISYRARSFK